MAKEIDPEVQQYMADLEKQIANKKSYLEKGRDNTTTFMNNLLESLQYISQEELVFMYEPLMMCPDFMKPLKKYSKKVKAYFITMFNEAKTVSGDFVNEHFDDIMEGRNTGEKVIAEQCINCLESLINAKKELITDLNKFRYRKNPNKAPLIELLENNIKYYQEKIGKLKK